MPVPPVSVRVRCHLSEAPAPPRRRRPADPSKISSSSSCDLLLAHAGWALRTIRRLSVSRPEDCCFVRDTTGGRHLRLRTTEPRLLLPHRRGLWGACVEVGVPTLASERQSVMTAVALDQNQTRFPPRSPISLPALLTRHRITDPIFSRPTPADSQASILHLPPRSPLLHSLDPPLRHLPLGS